jgi:hypothetical protein
VTASMFISNNLYQKGKFIVLYPGGNKQCQSAIEKYIATFQSADPGKTFFHPITLEDFFSHLKNATSAPWIDEFESRYLDFGKIEKLIFAAETS